MYPQKFAVATQRLSGEKSLDYVMSWLTPTLAWKTKPLGYRAKQSTALARTGAAHTRDGVWQ